MHKLQKLHNFCPRCEAEQPTVDEDGARDIGMSVKVSNVLTHNVCLNWCVTLALKRGQRIAHVKDPLRFSEKARNLSHMEDTRGGKCCVDTEPLNDVKEHITHAWDVPLWTWAPPVRRRCRSARAIASRDNHRVGVCGACRRTIAPMQLTRRQRKSTFYARMYDAACNSDFLCI